MTWHVKNGEIHVTLNGKSVAVFQRDDFPDMILAMCKVLKET